MTTLVSLGTHPLYYHSQSACVSTEDGVTYTELAAPFDVHSTCLAAASNTNGSVWLAASNTGMLSRSTDQGQSWNSYIMLGQMLSLRSVVHTGTRFLITGSLRYANGDERATVYASTTALNAASWGSVYENTNAYSALVDLTSVSSTVWAAVGYVNGMSQPLMVVSTNGGVNWTAATLVGLPSTVIHSVVYNPTTQRIHLGGQGWTAWSVWSLGTLNWTVRELGTEAIVRMRCNSTEVVAVSGRTAWFTNNSADWQAIQAPPGYNLTSLTEYDQKWRMGAHSLLNQFTGFQFDVGSTFGSPVTLNGYHIPVQSHAQWVS
jgi:hypothetical protein